MTRQDKTRDGGKRCLITWSELDWLIPSKTIRVDDPNIPSWRECKLLGSKLDTESDIRARKSKTLDALHTFKYIFNSKKVSNEVKLRMFHAFIGSIFLYNSELWTLTASLEEHINSFHRRLLRKVLGIRWPRKISNESLLRITQVEEWSRVIKRRRLNWFGHLLRLHSETSVK